MDIVISFIVAAVSSACFALVYHSPKSELVYCGLTGGVSWTVFSLISDGAGHPVVACFAAAFVITVLSRYFAAFRRTPATVFMIAGIFPLVPGAGIYYTAFFIIQNENMVALAKLIETVKYAAAIVLGMSMALTIPGALFRRIVPERQLPQPPVGPADGSAERPEDEKE